MVDAVICAFEMLFGPDFSSQIKSVIREARFWLINRFLWGEDRWMSVGK